MEYKSDKKKIGHMVADFFVAGDISCSGEIVRKAALWINMEKYDKVAVVTGSSTFDSEMR
ncbi:hypothetical protein [Paenibacillus pabuli]|uniref:hypothetical protein n=1 Tax=Paenibacillus pabuli TaxID=1472 RepID=UPI003CF6184D